MTDPELLPSVVLMGAESTGKTTLAKSLATHYKTTWVPEYLRLFVEQKGTLPKESDAFAIVNGHLDLVDKMRLKAYLILFLDTDLFTTCVYQRIYFETCPSIIEEIALQNQSGLYLFTEPDFPWVADPGQRAGPTQRLESHHLLMSEAKRLSLQTVQIRGTHHQRMTTAIDAVDHYLHDLIQEKSTSENQ